MLLHVLSFIYVHTYIKIIRIIRTIIFEWHPGLVVLISSIVGLLILYG